MDADDDAEPDADRLAWARRVAVEVQTLPARQASAVRLIYNHKLTYAEAPRWLVDRDPRGRSAGRHALQRLAPNVLRNS